jgi:nicotinate-nucleotide pyrophosphorylase (carboxylating)
MTKTEKLAIADLIRRALIEDIGDGDHTSNATIPSSEDGKVKLMAKDSGILAGVEVASMVFTQVDENVNVDVLIPDGSRISPGDIVMLISGSSRSILTAERTALNFIQRMSGIATFTSSVIDKISDLGTKLLDTRKTTPCNRVVEKLAVRLGGGTNHRFGLFDMIMIKDNHVDFAGGISNAISSTKKYLNEINKDIKIEIEVRNFVELDEVIKNGGVDRIMLDNFSPLDLKKAVEIIGGRFETEASGGISIDSIRSFALSGVDFISVGALTHQINSLDLSLVTC